MPTLKYNNAPEIMNCNHNECSFNHQLACTQDMSRDQIKPCGPGYTQDLGWAGGGMAGAGNAPGGCGWFWSKRVCKKLPPYDDYWNPLQTSLIAKTGPPDGYTPDNIQKAKNCCSNIALSNAEKEYCGELLWEGGTNPKPIKCASVLKRWCALDENMTDPKCFETVAADPKYFDLEKKCKSKTPGSEWDDICVCNYSNDFYQGINKSISDVWNVPPEYMDPRPECMYPQCKRSETRNKEAVCPTTSFTQCIQNTSFTANNSNIGDVIMKPEAECLVYTKIKKNVDPTGPTGPTGTIGPTTVDTKIADENAKNKKIAEEKVKDQKIAEENAKNQKMMFIAFIIIAAVIFLLKKKRRPTSTKGGSFLYNDSDIEGGENNLMLNSY